MSAKTIQTLSLEYEKQSIDQRFGPMLESCIKKEDAEGLIELQKISKNFVEARHKYLNTFVILKIVKFPLLLMFASTILGALGGESGLWRLGVFPVIFLTFLIYRHSRKTRMNEMLKHFKRAASHVERDKHLHKRQVDVDGDSYNLTEIGEKALDNAIRAICLTRKAIPVKKSASRNLGVGYGLVIGIAILAIGFLLGDVMRLLDPIFTSIYAVAAFLLFMVAMGMVALPHTDYNNLMFQLASLVEDYCYYRDLCYRFDVLNVIDYDQRFIAELAEPNLFSSLCPDILIYGNRSLI